MNETEQLTAEIERLRKMLDEQEIKRQAEIKELKHEIEVLKEQQKVTPESTTPYDDVWRTLATQMPRLLVPLINEVFSEHFSDDSEVIPYANEHLPLTEKVKPQKLINDTDFTIQDSITAYTQNAEGSVDLEKLLADADRRQELSEDFISKEYVFECESSSVGKGVSIRITQYTMRRTLDKGGVLHEDTYVFTVPHCAVISLRTTENTPHEMSVRMLFDKGEGYLNIHVMHLSEYTLDMIMQRKLYILIPFLPFLYEKNFDQIENDSTLLNKMLDDFKTVFSKTKTLIPEDEKAFSLMDMFTDNALRILTKKVINGLAPDKPNIREGVEKTVGGNIIEFEGLRIFREGEKKGIKEGIKEGIKQGEGRGEKKALDSVVKTMLRDKDSGEMIMRITGYERKSIDAIAKEIGTSVSWNAAAAN